MLSTPINVDGHDPSGAVIGPVEPGDTIEIKYESGKWSYDSRNCPRESPDAKQIHSEEQRCAIVKRYDPSVVLAIIPPDTRYHPFSYVMREQCEIALRMNDGRDSFNSWNFNDNVGAARYSVKIIPASSPAATAKKDTDTSLSQKTYARTAPVETSFPQFDNELALWYDFGDVGSVNEGAATVSDKSGGDNDGRVVGAGWRIGANGNGCFYFDGLPGRGRNTGPDEIHDFIRVSDSTLGFPLTDFTISVVCNPQNDGAIIGSGQNELWNREWNLTCDKFTWSWTRGHSSGAVGKEGYTLSFPSCMNACSHIVVKRENNVVSVYCNGVLQGRTAQFANQPFPIYSYGLFIGDEERDEFSTWRQWVCMKGEIYQVLIWRRALSEEEAGALYSNARSRFGIRGNR